MAAPSADDSPTTTVRTQMQLRDLILAGELQPGERISEQSVVNRIGASRTPVRTALVRLEGEGLLEPIPSGGYAVRSFTENDIFDAIEVRGTIEGLGARLAAERSPSRRELASLEAVADEIDEVLTGPQPLNEDAFARYAEINTRFHDTLRQLSASPVVSRQIERANAHPFASPSGFVQAQSALPEAGLVLTVAQYQHRCILEAIASGQGTRAEQVTREHARLAARNLGYALRDQRSLELVPGAALIATG
ncbi:MAG: GntR family transcriptional regulator [Actinomycetota bacterium]|nr:GntR family transcriptional regulator [Actinomycetota bacterium]